MQSHGITSILEEARDTQPGRRSSQIQKQGKRLARYIESMNSGVSECRVRID